MCVHVMYGGDSNHSWSTGQSVHGCVLPATRARDGMVSVEVHLWPPLTIKLGWLASRMKALGGRYESSHRTNTAETSKQREALNCLQEVQESIGRPEVNKEAPLDAPICVRWRDHRHKCHMGSLGPVFRGCTLNECMCIFPTNRLLSCSGGEGNRIRPLVLFVFVWKPSVSARDLSDLTQPHCQEQLLSTTAACTWGTGLLFLCPIRLPDLATPNPSH